MDANGLRSFSLRWDFGLQGWPVGAGESRQMSVQVCDDHRVPAVRLASRTTLPRLREAATDAGAVTLAPSLTRDAAGNYLAWDALNNRLLSVSHLVGRAAGIVPVPVALPDAAKPVRDLALGDDDIVYIAARDGLWLVDTRARFESLALALPEALAAHRLTALPGGGVMLLDVGSQRLARVRGRPAFTRGIDVRRERNDRFEPTQPNPDPLAIDVLPATFDAGERVTALAASPAGIVALLALDRGAGPARLRLLREDGTVSRGVPFSGPRFPSALGWVDAERIALASEAVALDPEGAERPDIDLGAFVYALTTAEQARLREEGASLVRREPLGDFHPLRGRVPGSSFVNEPPRMRRHTGLRFARASRAGDGAGMPAQPLAEPAPLARISSVARVGYGLAANFALDGAAMPRTRNALGLLDSGDASTAWHRLYVEAQVPRKAAVVVWLAASDRHPPVFRQRDDAGVGSREGWYPHLLGECETLPADVRAVLPDDLPRAAWVDDASEVPRGESLLGVAPVRGLAGLYTVLIQRAGLKVRTLKGRRLWVVLEFFGDGRASAEVAALRLYAGRVSYRDKHLPALYHERVFGTEAEQPGRATPADFLERYIDLFEGLFTPLEDRVAGAHLWTDALACPPENLPWLGAWVGLALEPDLPGTQQRRLLANAPQLARLHGTLPGLQLALDIATDGGVTRGRIVVVEHYRLRRALATILGAQLVDFDDPLTAGIGRSGNSVVGDTLFLGEEGEKEFLALFRTLRADPALPAADVARLAADRRAARRTLYDELAWRVTVLVHDAAGSDELRLVRRVAQQAAPAHVKLNVAAARHPFLVAVASLVGVDSFLREPQPSLPVRVEGSSLGLPDTLQGLASLDAMTGAFAVRRTPPQLPVAVLGPDRTVEVGTPFTIDASASRAPPGRHLTTYRWIIDPAPHA